MLQTCTLIILRFLIPTQSLAFNLNKLCMQWTELAAVGFTSYSSNIFFPFFSDKHYSYGENK